MEDGLKWENFRIDSINKLKEKIIMVYVILKGVVKILRSYF